MPLLRLSQSVTSDWQKRFYLLQIEIIRRAFCNSSRSVTVRRRFGLHMLQIETKESVSQKTAARESSSLAAVWAFAQIKPTKINLSLFGRLTLPEVEDERGAVLLLGFDQDVVDVGLDGAHGKE